MESYAHTLGDVFLVAVSKDLQAFKVPKLSEFVTSSPDGPDFRQPEGKPHTLLS